MKLTFAQGWKAFTLALIAGAGIVATVMLAWLVWIVWKGGWSVAVESGRLDMLAQVAFGMIVLMGLAMAGLLVAGPLHKISGKIGGNEIDVEGDDE